MKIALLPHAQNEPVPKPWFPNPLLVPVISVTAVVPSIMGHGSVGQHFGAICSILKLEATSTYHFNGICSMFERPICQPLVTPHLIRSTYMTHVDAESGAVHGDWSHVLSCFGRFRFAQNSAHDWLQFEGAFLVQSMLYYTCLRFLVFRWTSSRTTTPVLQTKRSNVSSHQRTIVESIQLRACAPKASAMHVMTWSQLGKVLSGVLSEGRFRLGTLWNRMPCPFC